MGDTEQVKMDSTPVFAGSAAPVRRRRIAAKHEIEEEPVAEDGIQDKKPGMRKSVRVMLLLSLIPIMYFIPKVLSMAGEKVSKNQHLLIYLWSVSYL